MKQFFLSAALLVGAALSFTACNNGTYDTDPASNNSGTGNPFNSGQNGGVTIGSGVIQFKANGNLKTFNVAGGAAQTDNALVMGTTTSVTEPREIAQLTINPFSGVANYIDNDQVIAALTYAKITNINNGYDFLYGSTLSSSGSNIEVTVDDGTAVKGKFTGKIWGGAGTTVDTLVITEGQFNLNRVQTP